MFLISIHPQHVAAILDGLKTVECRKSAIGLSVGDTLMLYATAPSKAVLGRATVNDIYQGTPDELWRLHGARARVSEADFFRYYATASRATFISLANVEKFTPAVPLERLREVQPGFAPPQTARRLGADLQTMLGSCVARA